MSDYGDYDDFDDDLNYFYVEDEYPLAVCSESNTKPLKE